MPGVPSGKGCDGCRKQKKKCDQAKPRCARCKRLDLTCIGAGVQRFKFKSQNKLQMVSVCGNISAATRQRSRSPTSSRCSDTTEEINVFPGTSMDRLTIQFMHMMRPTTTLRYNFVYAYGCFLKTVPKHLGFNEALDASVEATICAYNHFCQGHKQVVTNTLLSYTRALTALRLCLDDPIKACAPETLCSIMLLMICQNFIGITGRRSMIHSEGAVQILKARGHAPPRNELEAELLLSLRGPVVFEALFNHRIQMDRPSWEALVQNDLDDGSYEGQMMHCLSYAPDFMRRGRDVLCSGLYDPLLQTEIDIQYQKMKQVVCGMEQRMMAIEAPSATDELDMTQLRFLHGVYQRGYAIGMFVAIILNCTLTALSLDTNRLNIEAMNYANEIVAIAHQAKMYRPLGAAYIVLCLLAAFAGAGDQMTRIEIIHLMEDYYGDFQWPVEQKTFDELKNVDGRLLMYELDEQSSLMQKLQDLFAPGCEH